MKLSPQSLEIVRGMSGCELQDLAERGVELPVEARQRLRVWQEQQAAITRQRVLAGGDYDHFTAPGGATSPEADAA